MHWEKSQTSALARSRPYQGVRVRDPVKDLLRRKRSLELHNTKTAPSSVGVITHNSQSSYTQGIIGSDAASCPPADSSVAVSDGGLQSTQWKASQPTGSHGLQPAGTPWSALDYNQEGPPAQTLAYSASPNLTADVYMQTLCPSYTMLTYTHTPLLTNFGTIPAAQAPCSLPHMENPDSGVTYFPWAQSLTTISTMPSPAVQFAPGSATLSGSSLVHMPLSMSLATMIPQLEAQSVNHPHPILDYLQHSDHHLNPEPLDQSLDEDPGVESETPNLLDKLLEDQKEDGEEEVQDSYSSSLFNPKV